MSHLEVVSIEAKNVRGARRVKIQPGKVTVYRGRNASGKSSALTALTSIMGGGSLANLARIEGGKPTEPEIVLVMGEAGKPYQFKATKNKKGIAVKERVEQTQAFKDVLRPQEFLDGLFDSAGANPVHFLAAIEKSNPNEFVQLVLEALPIVLDRDRFEQILGEDADHVAGREHLAKLHPIEELKATVDALYKTREGVQRDQRNAHQASERLKRLVPAIVETKAVREELDAIDAEARTLANEVTRERSRIESEKERAETAATSEWSAAMTAAKAEYDRVVAAADAAVKQAHADAKATLEAAKRAAFEARDAATKALQPSVDALNEKGAKVASLKQALEQSAKNEALSKEAEQADADEARFKAHADRLTAKMDELEALKRSLGSNLPIKGLEIRTACEECQAAGKPCAHEGAYLDGIKARDANTARKVEAAVQLSTLRQVGTKMPFIVVDGAENLDSVVFDALVEELKSVPNLQAFIARVDDCDLVVESDGEPVGLVEVGPEPVAMEATA